MWASWLGPNFYPVPADDVNVYTAGAAEFLPRSFRLNSRVIFSKPLLSRNMLFSLTSAWMGLRAWEFSASYPRSYTRTARLEKRQKRNLAVLSHSLKAEVFIWRRVVISHSLPAETIHVNGGSASTRPPLYLCKYLRRESHCSKHLCVKCLR